MYGENPLKHNSHVEMIQATTKFIFLEFVLCLYRIYLLYSITKNIRTIKRLFSLHFYKIEKEKYDKYWFIPLFFFALAHHTNVFCFSSLLPLTVLFVLLLEQTTVFMQNFSIFSSFQCFSSSLNDCSCIESNFNNFSSTFWPW